MRIRLAGYLGLISILTFGVPLPAADEEISFSQDIRPILSNNCYACHGPDKKNRKADLDLTSFEAATAKRDDGAAIVAGDPDKSELVRRLVTKDESDRMPPVDSEKSLTPTEIDLIRRWIASGAKYEGLWSFQPVRQPTPPEVAGSDWVINPIDQFVAAKLAKRGLEPSAEADRNTLIRRVYLDLIGLPPSVSDVEAFAKDDRSDAYERVVDRLLQSEHFGERWARYWLDQARYADSNGYSHDSPRTMWPYRDWVIDAFNRDLPFDQFTIEQLAGDLLPSPSQDQLVATGFHRNTLINTEGGTKKDQFRVEQTKDRVDTTGVVWMGLTVGCANCHTHKYDPILQSEYYEMYAFFNSCQDANSVSPTIAIESPDHQAKLAKLAGSIKALESDLQTVKRDVQARQAKWERELAASLSSGDHAAPTWQPVKMTAASKHGVKFQELEDGSLLATGPNSAADVYTVAVTPSISTIRSIQLEALNHKSLPMNGPGRAGNGNLVLSNIQVSVGGRVIPMQAAWADHSQSGYNIAAAIDADASSGWAINGSPEGGANHDRLAQFVLTTPVEVAKGQAFTIEMAFQHTSPYNIGRFRISVARNAAKFGRPPEALARLAAKPRDKRSKAEQAKLDEAFGKSDSSIKAVADAIAKAKSELNAAKKRVPQAMIMRDLASPRETFIHVRGDFLRPGDRVTPSVPDAFPQIESTDKALTRLDFAKWLMRPDHPLTSRVRVNRIWMRLFGRGLVETENDFGMQGAFPTHPKLMNWLAAEFMNRGWSTKQFIRLIVTSATYRQASHVRDDLNAIDPRNELLGRQNRLRVEAEIVRDLGLTVSGLLTRTIGGPSVFPPQPSGVYAFTQVNRSWKASTGPDRYRRGMYTFHYRGVPHPMLTTFDVPKFNTTCTRRDRSNTPLQSLTVANDEAMFEIAQALGKRILRESSGSDADRIRYAIRLTMSRQASDVEVGRLSAYMNTQREYFGKSPADAAAVASGDPVKDVSAIDTASWISLARVLINLDEFITRE